MVTGYIFYMHLILTLVQGLINAFGNSFIKENYIWFQAQSRHLCNTILDVISSLYHQDNANYFILETQCTLSQFAEKIHTKHDEIQVSTTNELKWTWNIFALGSIWHWSIKRSWSVWEMSLTHWGQSNKRSIIHYIDLFTKHDIYTASLTFN